MGWAGSASACALLLSAVSGCGREESPLHRAPSAFEAAPLPPPTPARRAELERAITDLADIPRGPRGYAWAGEARSFAPKFDGEAERRPPDPFLRLVEAGPEAIPYLLARLTDSALTMIRTAPGDDLPMGAMWRSTEIAYDPSDADERRAVEQAIPASERALATGVEEDRECRDSQSMEEHTLRVGDVCFVILGNITNRRYAAIRGQPTRNFVVNSPVLDPRLAAAVRAMWEGRDPRRTLAARLARDLEGTPADLRLRRRAGRPSASRTTSPRRLPSSSQPRSTRCASTRRGLPPSMRGTEPTRATFSWH